MSLDKKKKAIFPATFSDPNYFIPYGRQWVNQTDISAAASVLSSPFLTTGPVATQFEQELCKHTGAKHAIVCSNGTTALHLACLALKIGKDDVGLTSPNTFLASANCIEFCGGKADFVDIDMKTLCLSPDKVEEYCQTNGAPRVVIPVDFAGVPAELPQFKALAEKYGFALIEDAAHSIGSSYMFEGKEYKCGSCTHTDLAIFSFHPVKTITSGEGGAVLTNSDDLAKRVRNLCSHGMVRCQDLVGEQDGPWYYEMEELGYNYRITDFQCALGLSQLTRLYAFKSRRQEIVARYTAAFSKLRELIVPPDIENTSPCFHLYTLQFKMGTDVRFRVYHELRNFKIYCQIHYIPVYRQPYYSNKYGYAAGKCPNSEQYYSRCISLPLFPSLTNDEVDYVIDKVIGFTTRP